MSLENRYFSVKNRINNESVNLLAVSKKQPIEKISSLYNLGQRMFGESYIQEAVTKIESLEGLDIQWHFIGPIQSNKTKYIAKYFNWVQSVDSHKILRRLNKQRNDCQSKLNVLLQLKEGEEESKRGLHVDELLDICASFKEYRKLKLRGLMSIPAPTSIRAEQLAQFKLCGNAFQAMQKIVPVDTLSIGMSNDLETAIECGSTMVRVGTDIFGKRV